jgi:putative membrane protein
MEDLLIERPEGVAAVFSGLVLASCVLVWRGISKRDAVGFAVIIGVAIAAFWLLGFQTGAVSDPSHLAFFATGAIAICAMILPGISGSFIMLMLGMYAAVLGGEPSQLIVFAIGAVVGLAVFSSILNWLLERYEQTLMAALLGLMLGSVRVLWPWPNGVGVIGDTSEETIRGTDLAWPDAGQLAGGISLALLAAAATLLIVRFAEAKPVVEEMIDETV